jgi:hypothetical protein
MTDAAPRRHRRLFWTAAFLGAVVAIALVLAKLTPDAYHRTAPLGSDPAALARFNEDVVNGVGNVLLDSSGGTALDVTLTEAMVNARLAQFVAEQTRAGQPLPDAVRRLRIAFEPGEVVVMTRLGQGLTEAVVSQRLSVEALPDGRLRVLPAGTRAGLLPLPEALVAHLGRALTSAAGEREPPAEDGGVAELWDAVLEALGGEPVALGKGRRRIVLERADVTRGTLHVVGRRDVAAKR